MTAPEMRKEFLVRYDKVASQGSPGYRNWEISEFLTMAQDGLLKSRLNPRGNKYGNTFDQTEKRKKDFAQILMPLTACTISASQSGIVPNGVIYDLPSNLMFTDHEQALTDLVDCSIVSPVTYKRVTVKPVTWDYVNANKHNPYKQPYDEMCWRLDVQATTPAGVGATAKRHMLVTDGTYSITNYYVAYLRRPRPIIVETLPSGITIEGYNTTHGVLDCELNEEIHREIVALAVKMASGAVQDAEGYQINAIENEKTE